MTDTVKVTLDIDNVYEVTGETIHTTVEVEVDVPPAEGTDDYQEWAEEEIMPHTGTGQTKGDAGYFVEISKCEVMPELVGRTFEWGI